MSARKFVLPGYPLRDSHCLGWTTAPASRSTPCSAGARRHPRLELKIAQPVKTTTWRLATITSRVNKPRPPKVGFCLIVGCALMWMQNQRSGEPTEEQPSISYTFRHVHRFILRAVQGDTAVASALFQRYLTGELPDELLALSRRCVQGDQKAGGLRSQTQGAHPVGHPPHQGCSTSP